MKAYKLLLPITVVFLVLWSLGPVVWTFITSISSVGDLTSSPPNVIPDKLALQNYSKLFGLSHNSGLTWKNMQHALYNSLFTSATATILVAVTSLMAGYAFARLRFPGKNLFFFITIATLVIPAFGVIIPLYRFMAETHLLNTYKGLVLVYLSIFAPVSLWLMKGFVESIPFSLEEAAMLEGAGRWKILRIIVFPLTAPGLVAVAILTFLGCWSQFATVLVFSPTLKNLTVFISEFVTKTSIDYPMMCAVGTVSMIPPILIVAFLNRYLIEGMVAGSVKG
jgi:multiple sugar transport system permease protein